MNDAFVLPTDPADAPTTYHRGIRPRDAAALIVVRFDGPAPCVLMGERHARHRFMPGKVVFPGGRLDRSDLVLVPGAGLAPHTEDLLLNGRRGPAARRRARGLALAAIRETFEEAGLLIGTPDGGGRPRSRAPAWRAFLDHGIAPDPARLHFLARAVTPPGMVRRFDTRFFLADAADVAAETAPPTDELLRPSWRTFAEARASDVPLITRAILDLAESRLGELAAGRITSAVPWFRVRHGRREVEWLAARA